MLPIYQISRGDIEQIEQDNRDVQRQKLELYGTWLQRCPNASWNDIILALENSKETTLANVIKTKFNIEISSDDFISCAKQVHNQVQLSSNNDPNAHDIEGLTSLMLASQNGYLLLVELLLKEKADPNAHSNEGWTPLLLASNSGHSNVVVMLLQYKANLHVEICKHWIPLQSLLLTVTQTLRILS